MPVVEIKIDSTQADDALKRTAVHIEKVTQAIEKEGSELQKLQAGISKSQMGMKKLPTELLASIQAQVSGLKKLIDEMKKMDASSQAFADAKSKVEAYSMGIERLTDKLKESIKYVQALKAGQTGLSSSTEKATNTIKKETAAREQSLGSAKKQVEASSSMQFATEKEIQAREKRIKAYEKEAKAQTRLNIATDSEAKQRAKKIYETEKALKALKKSNGEYIREIGRMETAFTKFAIVMSGLAATLFVFQSIMRGIEKFVQIGREMAESMAKLKLELKGVAENASKVEIALGGASKATGQSLSSTTGVFEALMKRGLSESKARASVDTVSKYMRYPGMTADRAAMVYTTGDASTKAALEKFSKSLDDSIGTNFDKLGQGFISLLRTISKNLEPALNRLAKTITEILDNVEKSPFWGNIKKSQESYGKEHGEAIAEYSNLAKVKNKLVSKGAMTESDWDNIVGNNISSKSENKRIRETLKDIIKEQLSSTDQLVMHAAFSKTLGQFELSMEIDEKAIEENKKDVEKTIKEDPVDLSAHINFIWPDEKAEAEKTAYETLGFYGGEGSRWAFGESMFQKFGADGKIPGHIDSTFGAGTSDRIKAIYAEQDAIKKAKSDALRDVKGYDLKELELDEKLFQEKQILSKNYITYKESYYKEL